MSNFTKEDFNTVMNYLEWKFQDLVDKRVSGEMTSDECKKEYHGCGIVYTVVQGDFNDGVFNKESN
jgi:hypothetical protein